MKDLSERLWPAFRAEVAEQLEALELLVVQRVDVSAGDVNAMFRHFHTIKGGCAMMGYANMGALAHAAEDALDPVRRQERVLDESLVDALLAAIDALKLRLQEAERTRRDGEPNDALVARLRQPAAAAAAPRVGAGAGVVGVPADPASAARLAFFAACLPRADMLLAVALQSALPAGTNVALKELRGAADAAGLVAVSQLLAAIAEAGDDQRQRLRLVAEAWDRIAALETQYGRDAGTQAALQVEAATLAGRLHDAARALAEALPPAGVMPVDGRTALTCAEDLLALAMLARLPQTVRLLRLACQVLRDVARRGLQADARLLELLVLAAGMPADLQADNVEDAPYAAMCASIHQRLKEAASAAASGRDLGALRESISARLCIGSDWLDALALQALERLAAAVARGDTVAEIEADMEAAPDGGAALVDWLDADGTRIGNQTVFHRELSEGGQRESTRLRFLATWRLSPEAIRHGLGRLDPQKRLYRLRPFAMRGAVTDAGLSSSESLPELSAAASPAGPAPAESTASRPNTAAGEGSVTAAPVGDARAALRSQQTLRVDSDVVDQFVNRIGELVTLRNMMAHVLQSDDVGARHRRARALLGQGEQRQLAGDELDELRGLLADLDQRHEQLRQTDMRIQGALGRMQEDVLALRVVPMATVFNRLPRVVRDISHAQHKLVRLDVGGEDVRVDKSLVDVLIEPLMHLVRNAVDHGIEAPADRLASGKPETATLSLVARQHGGTLTVEVSDDGRGLDLAGIRRRAHARALLAPEAIDALGERDLVNLIFLPGFSTAEQVTEVSGRGVGMDVVKTRIAQVGGQVEVRTQAGQGTVFTLKLPLSAAIQSVILVAAGKRELALPERSVAEILSIPASSLQSIQGQACCLLRGAMLPVYGIAALLGDDSGVTIGKFAEIVVVSDGMHRIGVLVDRVVSRPEVFVREVHEDIARLPGVGGVSILGSGQVVIILDGEKLLALAQARAQALRSLLRVS